MAELHFEKERDAPSARLLRHGRGPAGQDEAGYRESFHPGSLYPRGSRPLLMDDPARDPVPRVASEIGDLVIRAGMDDQRGAPGR